jgi:hypothetical protein
LLYYYDFTPVRYSPSARSRRSSGGNAITASWISASIVSGLSSGFSAYSHEIESVFDSPAGSIRAVRPTLPQGS